MLKLLSHWLKNTRISARLLHYATKRPYTHPRKIPISIVSKVISNGSKNNLRTPFIDGTFSMASKLRFLSLNMRTEYI